MTIPDYQSLMLPVLKLASEASGEIRVQDAEVILADRLNLSRDEREEMLPSGRQHLFYNRMQWAKTYLVRAGLLEITARGRFRITDRGKTVLQRNPTAIGNEDLMKYEEFREFIHASHKPRPKKEREDAEDLTGMTEDDVTPEEAIDSAYETISSALRAEVLQRVLESTPTFFERLIIDLLTAMGYGGSHADAAQHLGRSNDGGVDGLINEDTLGLERVYIQAKRYAPTNTVGRPEIQAFAGSLMGLGATKGVFVTTSSFSENARNYVERIQQRIILIDGTQLARLLTANDVGVRTTRTVQIKRVDEDYFAE